MRFLGAELGSTRIKSVIIDDAFEVVADGSHTWENRLEDGFWTYSLEDVWKGLNESIARLGQAEGISAAGISGMMHGYLAL
jgi:sugar (pentulose or hexulose) kinase